VYDLELAIEELLGGIKWRIPREAELDGRKHGVLELVVLFYEAVLYTRMYLSWRPCTSRRSCGHLWPRIAILYARMVLNWRSCMRVGSYAGGLIPRQSCMRVWT
jgi:hypothetical protein